MQNAKLSVQEVSQKMYKLLKQSDSGWDNLLKGFLLSTDFDNAIETLYKLVEEGERFTPPLKTIFRAFETCPLLKLKVIVVGQDPYPQLGVADGISFSCGNTMKKEASLRYIHDAIARTVYDNKELSKDMSPDLIHWSNQGVLMLNTSLTTEVGKIGKHFHIWKPFTNYLIDMLNHVSVYEHKSPFIWVFLGKKAQEFKELLHPSQIIIEASHPASAAYAKQKEWDCNNLFNRVNEELSKLHKSKILW
jgi:uracil-DNA glycosylase